ncbi:MAG TPA: galactokinase [Polyangiaceae bacterium]|nr:galactokinase [Polyangiaceae bacterium]
MSNTPSPDRRGPESLAERATRAFAAKFGRPAEWLVAAPGRVNVIGEHTDYSGGFVMPMAIERYVVIAAAPSGTGQGARLRLHSAAIGSSVDVALDAPVKSGPPRWSSYVRGVVAGFHRRGAQIPALDGWIESDVPSGAGLSSSAALEVAVATLLETASGTQLAPVEKAKLCQRAEHEFAGVPCGLMDQLIATLGDESGPLLIDCRSEIARSVPFPDRRASVLIANTNVHHALGDGAYARRFDECESAARCLGIGALRDATMPMIDAAQASLGPTLHRRARHVVTENARTLDASRAFEADDLSRVGALLYESHRSLRDDYEVSCPELDVLVEVAGELGEAGGVFGARMTGGGFGGCTVTLVRPDRVDAVATELRAQYERRTGKKLDSFVSRPARGARRLDPTDFR